MLEHVCIKHYRCLRMLSAPLKPLTILIGANDTGKSSFLAALNCLATCSKLDTSDYWRGDPALAVDIRVSGVAKGAARTVNAVWSANKRPPDKSVIAELSSCLDPCLRVQLPATGPATTTKGFADSSGPPSFDPSGGNIPTFLDYLLRTDRPRLAAIEEALRRLIPGFEQLNIATPTPDQRRLDFLIESGLKINGDHASTGVRLLAFFVSLAFHPEPPKLLLLEEPETGVHPRRLGEVMGLLKELTQGLHGRHATQVILTTHSPYLLDHVDPSMDQVLVFRREEDGSRTAEPVDEDRLKIFLDEFMLGEVWFNQGEENMISRNAP